MSPLSAPVLGIAALLTSPSLWNALHGTTPPETVLVRWLVAVLLCWVAAEVFTWLVGPVPGPVASPVTEPDQASVDSG